MAFSQCSSTLSQVTLMMAQCSAYTTIDVATAAPAQICQANAAALCHVS
jgi:hypothetical protein